MIGTIVHDLKNPLNVIINLSAHEEERAMRSIHQAGRQMLTLVMNILDVQKFEDAQIQLHLMPISPRKLLTDATRQVEVFLKQYNLQTQIILKTQLDALCDYELTERILVNLLTNAIKFSPPNQKISLAVEQQQQYLIFAIIDQGEGIPAEKHQIIFEKFAQIKKHSLGNKGSTGLGLTFCKMAVEAQGGRIWVESEIGKGTTFYFTIPISLDGTKHDAEISSHEEHLLINKPTPNITPDEEKQIEDVRTLLCALEVYQYSDIMEVLENIKPIGEGVRMWLNSVETSLLSANEDEYNKIVRKKTRS
jgi:signal transduction histidine kinase